MSVVPVTDREAPAAAEADPAMNGKAPDAPRMKSGAEFIFSAPEKVPPVWGRDDEVLWSKGEPLILVSRPGTGKTTLAGQLALGRVGIGGFDVLGYPIAPSRRPVLYIAADRPQQIARSFRRMVRETDEDNLERWLKVWDRPLPFLLNQVPRDFTPWLQSHDIGTVVIDSLGVVAFDLAKDEAGSRVAYALREAVAEGIEVLVLHHERKREQGKRDVRRLDDLYGSQLLNAAAGSVIHLEGEPGDPIVQLRHLKQPAAEVGPLQVIHDHEQGRSDLFEPVDPVELVRDRGEVTAAGAAVALFGTQAPSPNEVEKARRKLEGLVQSGKLGKDKGPGKTDVAVYREVEA